MRHWYHLFVFALFVIGVFAVVPEAYAFSIVPCGDNVQVDSGSGVTTVRNECTICDLQALAQNLLNWFVVFSIIVAAVLFVYAGVLYVMSPGNPAHVAKGHRVFLNTLLGIVIILAAYLLIDVVMKTLLPGEDGKVYEIGPWNKILCEGVSHTHTIENIAPVSLHPVPDHQTTQAEIDAFRKEHEPKVVVSAGGNNNGSGTSGSTGPCDSNAGGSGCLGQVKGTGEYIRPEQDRAGLGVVCSPNCTSPTLIIHDAWQKETYLPGCMDEQQTGYTALGECRDSASYKAGVTYARRLPVVSGVETVLGQFISPGTGDMLGRYEFGVSATPGKLQASDAATAPCYSNGGVSQFNVYLTTNAQESYQCPLEMGHLYYANSKASGVNASQCGFGIDCWIRSIFWPSAPAQTPGAETATPIT